MVKERYGDMEMLAKEAICDCLTGLYNRNCFHLDLTSLYTETCALGVLYFDLNNLKEINDTLHHKAGDEVLQRIARSMKQASLHMKRVRCYRVGGDEFVLMMKDCNEQELEHCKSLIKYYLDTDNKKQCYPCLVAIGHAFAKDCCDPETLVAQADHQMYLEKQRMKRS